MSRLDIFFNVYKDTVPKIFFGGFRLIPDVEDYTWLIRALLHLALLPISLTFGAGLFALVHALTRKPLPEEVVASDKEAFENLSDEDINKLSDKLDSLEARSNSSKKLIETLKDAKLLPEQKKSQFEYELVQFKFEKQIEQAQRERDKLYPEQTTQPIGKFFTHQAIQLLKLDQDLLQEVAAKQSEIDDKLAPEKFNKVQYVAEPQRNAIRSYFFGDETKNNGKKTHAAIHELIDASKPMSPRA